MQQYSDVEIIEQILSGKNALFEVLMRRHNSVLYKTGRGYGFDHQETEDLMQETYMNGYRNLAKFEQRSSFKTWLVRIMVNQCYHKKLLRRRVLEKPMDFSATLNSNIMSSSNNNITDRSVLSRELNSVIERGLEKLPEDYRLTFTLRELAGMNVADTASLTNTTVSNVKVRLQRAKLMLRKEIESNYLPGEIYEFNLIHCDKIVAEVMQRISKEKLY